MVSKKAQQATEAALTGLDRVAKTIESNHKAWGLNPKLASALVHQLDKIADSLEQGMFGEESLLLRQASLLGKTSAKMAPEDWTKTDKGWVQRVQYSGGITHTWTVEGEGKSFTVKVRTEGGTWKGKKTFASLEAAQKFAWRYMSKAQGADLLESDIPGSFTKA